MSGGSTRGNATFRCSIPVIRHAPGGAESPFKNTPARGLGTCITAPSSSKDDTLGLRDKGDVIHASSTLDRAAS